MRLSKNVAGSCSLLHGRLDRIRKRVEVKSMNISIQHYRSMTNHLSNRMGAIYGRYAGEPEQLWIDEEYIGLHLLLDELKTYRDQFEKEFAEYLERCAV